MKARLLWITVLCALSLASCSEAKKPLDPSIGHQTQIEASHDLLARFAQVRKMGTTAPLSPAKHFRLLGKITFHTANGDIEQDAELWLAGPHRMSFQLGTAGLLNDFRLFDAEHCWLKPAGGEFADYDSVELLTETILRWEVLRFPWGWEEPLAAAKLTSVNDLSLTLEKQTIQGPMRLETGRNGLPKRVKLAGSSLVLGDWKLAEQPQSLVPRTWQWQYQTGKRSEVFSSIRGHALFQDNAFRPVQGENLSVDRLISALDNDPSLGDEFGVVQLTLRYLQEQEHADFDGELVRGRWWQVGAQRYFVAALEEQQPDAGWQSSSNALWLRWSTYANTSVADGIKSLAAVMAQTGYHATGDCWALLPPEGERNYRRVFLMPVAKD